MGFADKFVASVGSSNLMDDVFHADLNPIAASALAGDIGSILCRVKYGDGTISRVFEGNPTNLAQLLRIWTDEVTRKGRERRWVKEGTAWDMQAALALYQRVALRSLAQWLDGKCKACNGTGVTLRSLKSCTVCAGSGETPITCAGGFELERIRDMVSELSNMSVSHAGRAGDRLREPRY
jgi:hypothetical protein